MSELFSAQFELPFKLPAHLGSFPELQRRLSFEDVLKKFDISRFQTELELLENLGLGLTSARQSWIEPQTKQETSNRSNILLHVLTVSALSGIFYDLVADRLSKQGYQLDKQFLMAEALLHDATKRIEISFREKNKTPPSSEDINKTLGILGCSQEEMLRLSHN